MKPAGLRTVWIAPLTVIAAVAGFAAGVKWLFPLACMAPAYPAMFARLRAGQRSRAVAAMLVWVATLAPTSVALNLVDLDRGRQTIIHGEAYVEEMFHWISTGEGTESQPRAFVVQHAVHLGLFVLLSLLTASLASIFFGTILLNYMAFYVASVIHAADGAALAVLMAWHPWSALRVVAFVILGVVLAEPGVKWLTGQGPPPAGRRPYVLWALAGLIVDALVKAALAPQWQRWLRGLTG